MAELVHLRDERITNELKCASNGFKWHQLGHHNTSMFKSVLPRGCDEGMNGYEMST